MRLELTRLHRSTKKRYRLYFIAITENPDDNKDLLLAVFPNIPIYIGNKSGKTLSFLPSGADPSGLTVFEPAMPEDRHIKMRLYFYSSRDKTRDFFSFTTTLLKKLKAPLKVFLSGNVIWYSIAREALQIISEHLEAIEDKEHGMISLDEHFDTSTLPIITRTNVTSTKEFALEWRWVTE